MFGLVGSEGAGVAFTATLVDKKRDGIRITVSVMFADDAIGWEHLEHFTFSRGDTLTPQKLVADITEAGTRYKAAIARSQALESNIGNVITI